MPPHYSGMTPLTDAEAVFLAFTLPIIGASILFAVLYRFLPRRLFRRRFRVVDRATGEILSRHWMRSAAARRARALSWPTRDRAAHLGVGPAYGFERVQ